MRILCDVERLNRPSNSLCGNYAKKKPTRSFVGIGFLPGKPRTPEFVRILITSAENRNGVEYKIQNNVEKVFAKFVDEGKTTIRFKEPPEDLMLKNADPLQLKSFLNAIRKSLNRDEDGASDKSFLSSLTVATTSELKAAKVKLSIMNESTYLQTKTYPKTLKNLTINNARLRKIDCRIFSLKHILVLNLSNNRLNEIPNELGCLSLEELDVSHNILETLQDNLFCENLRSSLRYLNVSNNQIQRLPRSFCKLSCLTTFNANSNLLTTIPQSIGRLKALKYFWAANNRLSYLPGTIRNLILDSIDVSQNPLNYNLKPIEGTKLHPPMSLFEYAARAVLENRLVVKEGDLPKTLIDGLSCGQQCWCEKFFVYNYWQLYSGYNLKRCSKDVTYVRDSLNQNTTIVPVDNKTCSPICAVKISSDKCITRFLSYVNWNHF